MVKKLVADLFLSKKSELGISLDQYFSSFIQPTFSVFSSPRLPKYISTKVPTTCFYLI